MSDREFDVILLGATGFTGALVAEYLVQRGGARWALAGRSQERLEATRRRLAEFDPAAGQLPILLADSFDRGSLDAIARRTRAVCTTVGPYLMYGEALVAACADAGTSYCDLTGEVPFVRRMIDGYGARAAETGARIVHCCGFDSIPSDLGVWMLHAFMRERGGRLVQARLVTGKSRGGFSGGTAASAIETVEVALRDPAARKLLLDPYALDPAEGLRGPDRGEQQGVRYDEDMGCWTGPFFMAPVNARVVRRSNAVLGYPYGEDFRYDESMGVGPGLKGRAGAASIAAGMGAFFAGVAMKPTRALLQRFALPAPGEGPDREARESGFFNMHLFGEGVGADGAAVKLVGRVVGTRDPGYGETAKMLGESALCLALDGEGLPVGGGSWTPASAMGDRLLERLRAAGMTFSVERVD